MVPQPDYPYPEFEYLDFTYSSFGKPEIKSATIRVPVRDFLVVTGFTGYEHDVFYKRGVLAFTNVFRSQRRLFELVAPGSKEFKPSYTITDGPFPEVNQKLFLFYLGGPMDDPPGWIEWYILAPSVQVEDAER